MKELTVVEPGKLRWLDKPSPKMKTVFDAIIRPIAACKRRSQKPCW